MTLRERYAQLNRRRVAVFIGRCLLGLLGVAAMTAILADFYSEFSSATIALLFLIPVGAAATWLGLAPGILSAFFSFLSLNFFFTQPRFTLTVAHTQDLLNLVVFLIVTVAISQLMGRTQASLQEATSRERDVIHLYELMATLASMRKQEVIARTAANRLFQVFHARLVEVIIQPDAHAVAQMFRAPDDLRDTSQAPDEIVALITPRGLLGEVHLWHARVLTPAEERLLNTFASQVALALERAILAQAENRAKVLEESDRLKSALLSSVSHELRTPLSTIKASISSLRNGNVSWDSPAREDLLAAVDEESDNLNRLVGNLLDMSRIEAGALKPQLQWNILADILDSALNQMRRIAGNHRLQVDVSDDLPLVSVDHMQIERVFTNLISNSFKYAPAGSTVTISAHVQDEKYMLVEVSNEGPQVSEEHIDRIFDKFYRVTASDQVTGAGLGLSICKGIIEAHGARIWARNHPHGLTFYFTLPLTLDGQHAPNLPAEVETTE